MKSNRNCLMDLCLFFPLCSVHVQFVWSDVLCMWRMLLHTLFMLMCTLPFVLVYNSWEECLRILYGFIFQPWEVKAYLSEWVWRLNLLPRGFRPGWGLWGWWGTGKARPPSGEVCMQQVRGGRSPCRCGEKLSQWRQSLMLFLFCF